MIPKVIAAALLIQTASAFDLRPGQPFPEIPLPTAEKVSKPGARIPSEMMGVSDFRGQKLMLHVFASW